MKEISLTQGKVAIVDDEDFEWLSQHKWQVDIRKHPKYSSIRYYAKRGENGETILMHREIASKIWTMDNLQVDHWDLDGLHNFRSNLRPSTNRQNHGNLRKQSDCSSPFKGVSWHRRANKWMASGHHNGKSIYLGLFESEVDAAMAYDRCAVDLFGEFARLNFA